MKRAFLVPVSLVGILMVSGCLVSYNTYGGADVIEARRVSLSSTINYGLLTELITWDPESITDINEQILTFTMGPTLSVGYGMGNMADITFSTSLTHMSGNLRWCFYKNERRSKSRTSYPYWVATADLGVTGVGSPLLWAMAGKFAVVNPVIYPGITFGAVGQTLEGYGRLRYYYNPYYTKSPLIDPHFGLSGGLILKAGPWNGLIKRVVNPWELTLVVGRVSENDRFSLRAFDVGTGLGLQF